MRFELQVTTLGQVQRGGALGALESLVGHAIWRSRRAATGKEAVRRPHRPLEGRGLSHTAGR